MMEPMRQEAPAAIAAMAPTLMDADLLMPSISL